MKKIAVADIKSNKIDLKNKWVKIKYLRDFRRPFTVVGVLTRIRKKSMIIIQEDSTRITIGYRTIIGATIAILENKRLKL